jgi:hypothetical protein
MPITDIAVYAHLSEADIEGLGSELDAIRRGIEDSRGANDAAYIRRTMTFQKDARCRGAPAHRRQPVEGGLDVRDGVACLCEEG